MVGDQLGRGQTDPSLSIFFWIGPHLNSGITVEGIETKAVSHVHNSVKTEKHSFLNIS